MSRRAFGLLALAAALAALALLAYSGGPRPDLILISVDTLRADRLPFYGGPRDTGGDPEREFTPSWLAARGTLFETCWSTAGQTLPALGSFWTGLPPPEHGAVDNETPVLAPTRLAALRKEGFERAHALVANVVLRPGCGLERGFDTYAPLVKELEPTIPAEMLKRTGEDVKAGRRLLAWAHFMAPHQPYAPPEAEARRYGAEALFEAGNERLYALHRAGAMSAAERAALEILYDAEVRTASEYVRELLAGLDAQYRAAGRGGLLDNAVVVFFADHGEELGDRHGYSMHAKSLYAPVVRVPLLIAGPGWAAERRAEAVSLLDALPLALGERAPRREVHFASWRTEFYAARDERWSLVHNPSGDPRGPREPPQDAPYPYPVLALYDRAADPRELRDVSAEHPAEARRLLQELGAWYAGLQFAADGARTGLSVQDLQQLGYAAGAPQREEIRLAPHPPSAWQPAPR